MKLTQAEVQMAMLLAQREGGVRARLRKLALAEGECPDCGGTGVVGERAYPPGQAVTTCSNCNGTGRIVPFASLRVDCWEINPAFHKTLHKRVEDYPCCQGLNWVPEPDVEKACWRVGEFLEQQDNVYWWYDCTYHTWRWQDGSRLGVAATSAIEACLRGAEAWLDEREHRAAS